MNHWPFILAAYVIVFAATATIVLLSLGAMRRAETSADAIREERP